MAFAKRIAKCYRFLKEKKDETIMSKQLLRCGTSIGANVREGQYAQSKKDFISKMNIALKEAGETDYWLDVIHSAEYFTDVGIRGTGTSIQVIRNNIFPQKSLSKCSLN